MITIMTTGTIAEQGTRDYNNALRMLDQKTRDRLAKFENTYAMIIEKDIQFYSSNGMLL